MTATTSLAPATPGALAARMRRPAPLPAPVASFDRHVAATTWAGQGGVPRWAVAVLGADGSLVAELDGRVENGTLVADAAEPALLAAARKVPAGATAGVVVTGAGLADLAPALPDTWAVLGLDSRHPAWRALMDLRSRLQEEDGQAVDAVEVPPLVVATDASACRAEAFAGIAAVSAEGAVAHGAVRCGRVSDAEALGLALALRSIRRTHGRRLILESDSTTAVAALEEVLATGQATTLVSHRASVALVTAAARALARGPIEVRWVKGHAGHELNEHADRVANAARRAQECSSTAVLDRIASEVSASLHHHRALAA